MKALAIKEYQIINKLAPVHNDYVIEFREKARKMAHSILKRWRAHLDLDELNSIVDLSLCEAVNKFDDSKGTSFITFMFYYLKGNLIKTINTLINEQSVNESDEIDKFSVNDIIEITSSKEEVLADEKMYLNQMLILSKGFYNELDKLERIVLQRIFVNDEPLIEVAADLGYSRCHITRIKKQAIETLQNKLSQKTGEVYGEVPCKKFGIKKHKVNRRRPKTCVSKKA